jgi:hypothetical protein
MTDQAVLAEIARTDWAYRVRRDATAMMTDAAVQAEVARSIREALSDSTVVMRDAVRQLVQLYQTGPGGFQRRSVGISLDLLAIFDDKTATTRDRRAPTVGVYFGFTRYPGASPALSGLLKEAAMGQQSAVKSLQSAQAHSWFGGLR